MSREIKCVINQFSGPNYRIMEYRDNQGKGGLISFRSRDDGMDVLLYEHDKEVKIVVEVPVWEEELEMPVPSRNLCAVCGDPTGDDGYGLCDGCFDEEVKRRAEKTTLEGGDEYLKQALSLFADALVYTGHLTDMQRGCLALKVAELHPGMTLDEVRELRGFLRAFGLKTFADLSGGESGKVALKKE